MIKVLTAMKIILNSPSFMSVICNCKIALDCVLYRVNKVERGVNFVRLLTEGLSACLSPFCCNSWEVTELTQSCRTIPYLTLIFPSPSSSKEEGGFKKISGFSGTTFPNSETCSLEINLQYLFN